METSTVSEASQVWPVLIKRALCACLARSGLVWSGLAWPGLVEGPRVACLILFLLFLLCCFNKNNYSRFFFRCFLAAFCVASSFCVCFVFAAAAAWKPQIWSVLWSRFVSCLYIGSAAPLPPVTPPRHAPLLPLRCWRPFSSRALFPLAMWMVSLPDRHRPIAI